MAQDASLKTEDLAAFVPASTGAWRAVEDRSFDPETIFDYIDGSGEVYRSYKFRRLFARRFEAAGQAALIVDLFDMGSAADAFGVFTHDREGEDAGFGQGGTYKGGLLSFWQGPYFVSVYAESETPATRAAVFDLGRRIAAAIKVTGDRPDILAAFPESGLDERTVRYFHTHFILNYHFFVAAENILRLGQDTDAVLATYVDKARLLVVRYPDAGHAAEALRSFTSAYMPDAARPGYVRTENGAWTAVRQKGRVVTVVFDAATEAAADELLTGVFALTGKID
ncbi:MAG: hypothetical protein OEW05_03960 [Candidatus Aminicenantes bacterium]|nr:hypothetical protein [Candidatus Aminicenantes bacterium]